MFFASKDIPNPMAPAGRDRTLLARAWALPVASTFAAHFEYQRTNTTCGPSSLANVRRSFGEPLSEAEVLRHTRRGVFGVCPDGLTLDQLAHLARVLPHGQATLLRGLTYPEFQQVLRRVNDPDNRCIINFHRMPLFGQGGGHFSPIAGYLEDRDLVLVLDVNSHYRPYLVRSERLFAAMDTIDAASAQKRGLLVLR